VNTFFAKIVWLVIALVFIYWGTLAITLHLILDSVGGS